MTILIKYTPGHINTKSEMWETDACGADFKSKSGAFITSLVAGFHFLDWLFYNN